MELKKLKKIFLFALIIYAVIALVFWLCAKEQMYRRMDSTDMIQENGVVGEITSETTFTQMFTAEDNSNLIAITLKMASFDRENTCDFVISVLDGETVLSSETVKPEEIINNKDNTFIFESPAVISKGKKYTISITSPNGTSGNAFTVYKGNVISAGKAEVDMHLSEEMRTHLNGGPTDYSLCWSLITETPLMWGKIYIYAVLAAFAALLGYCAYIMSCFKKGKSSFGLRAIIAFTKYRYLIKQLVSRDFKTKYKRSVLGVLWSFLNPLLMLMVQFIVFSTLFKSSIPNYALYLIIGIICFNFFSECAGMCLNSITGNASLITKVYMPKYIYPVSRALSSSINLLFSLIPLLGVMLITQTGFNKAVFLVPIPLVFLFVFSLGMGMILATLMVFFRDMQFLWSVISMVWMYMTPIFYPESILPANYLTFFKMNPLFHIIRLMRVMILDGVSPEPKAYIVAALMSFGALLIGTVIFRKNQDKFVLNI